MLKNDFLMKMNYEEKNKFCKDQNVCELMHKNMQKGITFNSFYLC